MEFESLKMHKHNNSLPWTTLWSSPVHQIPSHTALHGVFIEIVKAEGIDCNTLQSQLLAVHESQEFNLSFPFFQIIDVSSFALLVVLGTISQAVKQTRFENEVDTWN